MSQVPTRARRTRSEWAGWSCTWGENPPYHHPVFVLTQPGQDIWLAGGASVINQYLAAGLVDEIDISIAPVIMAGGERLFEELKRGAPKLTQIRAIDAPGVTHIKYQVG